MAARVVGVYDGDAKLDQREQYAGDRGSRDAWLQSARPARDDEAQQRQQDDHRAEVDELHAGDDRGDSGAGSDTPIDRSQDDAIEDEDRDEYRAANQTPERAPTPLWWLHD